MSIHGTPEWLNMEFRNHLADKVKEFYKPNQLPSLPPFDPWERTAESRLNDLESQLKALAADHVRLQKDYDFLAGCCKDLTKTIAEERRWTEHAINTLSKRIAALEPKPETKPSINLNASAFNPLTGMNKL